MKTLRRNGQLWDKLTGKERERREQRQLATEAVTMAKMLAPKTANPKKKAMTYEQAERAKQRSANAYEQLQGDTEAANYVDSLSVEEWAEEKGIELLRENPAPRSARIRLARLERLCAVFEARLTKLEAHT